MSGLLALLLVPAAEQAEVASPAGSAAAAIPARIAFAPPLDHDLILTRIVERTVRDGRFVETSRYRLRFAALGRGYTLTLTPLARSAGGPAELVRLYHLGDGLIETGPVAVSLDGDGAILGLTEPPEAAARFAAAIAKLRADPATADRPPAERDQVLAVLDQLAGMDAAARGELLTGAIAPLFQLAGIAAQRAGAEPMLVSRLGFRFVPGGVPADGLIGLAAQADKQDGADAGTHIDVALALDPSSGLARSVVQTSLIRTGAVTRQSQTRWQLDDAAE